MAHAVCIIVIVIMQFVRIVACMCVICLVTCMCMHASDALQCCMLCADTLCAALAIGDLSRHTVGLSCGGRLGHTHCARNLVTSRYVLYVQIMQEVESHWASGRALPDESAASVTGPIQATPLHACLMSINAALALRHGSIHSTQVDTACHH